MTNAPQPRRRSRILQGLLIAAPLVFVGGIASLWFAYPHMEHSPGELMRYAERRLIGHPKLEFFILPIFRAVRPLIERPVAGPFPTLGKGQQSRSLPPQRYTAEGQPLPVESTAPASDAVALDGSVLMVSEADFEHTLSNARPGQVLEVAPGAYSMKRSIHLRNGGEADRPIVLRARIPGSVVIESAATEGFHVLAPYWIFENLVIRGICQEHSNCEHAFHVVGKARNTVIRNNRIEDFNAHVKVNGIGNDWPDGGLIQYNTFRNGRTRRTGNPVTPLNIDVASRWQVADNVIAHFVKDGGNGISYGVFMKGAGEKGRIERNLIICTERDISQAGVRVGLSFGGGGMTTALCRDKRCDFEHRDGIAANNIIAHCNDVGIDIHRSVGAVIVHNTLINTAGIGARGVPVTATVRGNLMDGQIRARNDAWLELGENRMARLGGYFTSSDSLDLEWIAHPSSVPVHPAAGADFCRNRRPSMTAPGAFGFNGNCRGS